MWRERVSMLVKLVKLVVRLVKVKVGMKEELFERRRKMMRGCEE